MIRLSLPHILKRQSRYLHHRSRLFSATLLDALSDTRLRQQYAGLRSIACSYCVYIFILRAGVHVAPAKRMPPAFFIGIFSSGNRKRTHAVKSTTATADHQSPLSVFRSKTRWYSGPPNAREKGEITPKADLQKIIRVLINRARGCVEVGLAHFSIKRGTSLRSTRSTIDASVSVH
jgi:hypothetical protein